MNKIIIHCDGGCRNNQSTENVGAWAAILQFDGKEKIITGTAINTTNNKMELIACIQALQAIKVNDFAIEIFSDSQYLVSAFNEGWIINWIANGWRNAKKQPVENQDLWKMLLDLKVQFNNNITFNKTKGHSDDQMNNRVDALVNKAMDSIKVDELPIDKMKKISMDLAIIANLSDDQTNKIYDYLKEIKI